MYFETCHDVTHFGISGRDLFNVSLYEKWMILNCKKKVFKNLPIIFLGISRLRLYGNSQPHTHTHTQTHTHTHTHTHKYAYLQSTRALHVTWFFPHFLTWRQKSDQSCLDPSQRSCARVSGPERERRRRSSNSRPRSWSACSCDSERVRERERETFKKSPTVCFRDLAKLNLQMVVWF
jgi:hypothetical protein